MSIGVGLLGFGLAGRYLHAPFLAPAGFILHAVATSRRQEVAELYPKAVTAEAEAVLERPDIDLVVVATPNDSHAALAGRALAAGKHVVVDKPMTVTVAEADGLLEASERAGRILTVYQNRRWDADFLTVREVLQSGELGRLALFESRWDRFRPQVQNRWREEESQGGGLLNDLGPHLVDQALQLFGWPDWVQADLVAQREGAAVDDAWSLRLAYGEMRAVLEVSSLSAESRPRFHLHGSGAAYVKRGLDPQEAQLRAAQAPLDPGFGQEDPTQQGMLVTSGTHRGHSSLPGRWLAFWEALAEAIRSGRPPPVDPTEARDALSIIETARESARAGRRLAPAAPLSARYRRRNPHV